jgi:hypothetical protein
VPSKLDNDSAPIRQMLGEVVARTGVKLDANDPAVAVVVLNQLVMERVVARMTAEVRATMDEFRAGAATLQSQLGAAVAQEVKAATREKAAFANFAVRLSWPAIVLAAIFLVIFGWCLGCWYRGGTP